MSLLDRILRRNKSRDIGEDMSIYKDEPSEKSTSRFASFVFGFFALLVTLLIAAGLFFGGRAVYRALNGSSDNKTAAPAKSPSNQKASTKSAKSSSSSKSSTDKVRKTGSTPSTGDNLPDTGDDLTLPKTGDPGM